MQLRASCKEAHHTSRASPHWQARRRRVCFTGMRGSRGDAPPSLPIVPPEELTCYRPHSFSLHCTCHWLAITYQFNSSRVSTELCCSNKAMSKVLVKFTERLGRQIQLDRCKNLTEAGVSHSGG